MDVFNIFLDKQDAAFPAAMKLNDNWPVMPMLPAACVSVVRTQLREINLQNTSKNSNDTISNILSCSFDTQRK